MKARIFNLNDRRFYVYGFFCETWKEFFYIGKGTGNRINDNKRNSHVLSILENHHCKRVKLIENLTETEAIELEYSCKMLLRSLGKPLIDYENGKQLCQREGILRAKRNGAYKGRKAIEIDTDIFKAQYERYNRREITKTELAKVLNVSRPTLDKMLKEYNKNNESEETNGE